MRAGDANRATEPIYGSMDHGLRPGRALGDVEILKTEPPKRRQMGERRVMGTGGLDPNLPPQWRGWRV
jgi:hypothetical protein